MTRTFYQRNALRILLVSALCWPPTMIGAYCALESNRNEVADWLPEQYAETTTFRWFRRHFANEQFILASWDGCTLDDHRLKSMTASLAAPRPHERPADRVVSDRGGKNRKDGSGTRDPSRRRYFNDEVVTGRTLFDQLTSEPIKLSQDEALERLQGTLIGDDGTTTCLVLTLTDEGKQHPREAVEIVRRIATDECAIPPDTLHLGGPPVDNVAIDDAGEQSLYRLAGLAAVIGLVISWWCLRSARLIVFVFSAGIYAAAASLAIVWWSPLLLGHWPGTIPMNAVLLAMPSLVYVATVSGAIHLSNYYRDELAEGRSVKETLQQAIQHAALPLTLATTTTAVGLLTLCYSELVPIKLFGFFSALGVLVSMLLLFLYVPACFRVWPLDVPSEPAAVRPLSYGRGQDDNGRFKRPSTDITRARFWHGAGETIIRRHGVVSVGCLLILSVCALGMPQIETSVHLMKLFPPNARILSDYRWLETHLGALVPVEVVLKIDRAMCSLDFLERLELVERVQAKLKELPDVGGVLSAVSFVPHLPRAEEHRRRPGVFTAIARIAVKDRYQLVRKEYTKYLEKHRDDLVRGDYLADDDGKDLWRISARVGALTGRDFGELLKTIEESVQPVVHDELAGGGRGIQVDYTGLVPLVTKAQRSLLQGLIWGFISDFVLITIVMMVAVRDWSAGLILALPSVFPAAVVFGFLGWAGVVVDIGTVMTPSVALGVTVDDVVHFMIRYRGGLKLGLDRRGAVMLAYKGCAKAMYQSWGVIGLGLSVFALSQFMPTQRFGFMMVSLLTSALIGNLLLLPALLASPLGGLFGRRYTKHRAVIASAGAPAGPHAGAGSAGQSAAHRSGERARRENGN
jgi:predicted RND superfamily exporter protein